MAHEGLDREHGVEGSSDRSFGGVFAGVFLIVALWPLIHAGRPRWWALGVSIVLAGVALARPSLLHGLNKQWTRLGILMGKVVSPIALGVVFFGVVAPLGAVMRLAGKDPLRLKRDDKAPSYWIPRRPPGPQPGTMTRQF